MKHVLVLLLTLLFITFLSAEENPVDRLEEEGVEQPVTLQQHNNAQQPLEDRDLRVIPPGGLLLIPDSTTDYIMAFDPVTGDLIDQDFIVCNHQAHPTSTSMTPVCAIFNYEQDAILVSDQVQDAVFKYDTDGNYLGLFAPAEGYDTAVLDNVRGIALDPAGHLLVTVGGGGNNDAIVRFDRQGSYDGLLVAAGAGGLDSPFDIILWDPEDEYLVGGFTSDALHRYDLQGNPTGTLATIGYAIEQINFASNGNILAAVFSGDGAGVQEFDPQGNLIGIYHGGQSGFRGCYELPSGNILATTGLGVFEISRDNTLVDTKIDGASARFIELVVPSGFLPPENVGIQIFNGQVFLSWDAIEGVDSYNVYSSTDPYENFTIDNTGSFDGAMWIAPAPDQHIFYHVRAVYPD